MLDLLHLRIILELQTLQLLGRLDPSTKSIVDVKPTFSPALIIEGPVEPALGRVVPVLTTEGALHRLYRAHNLPSHCELLLREVCLHRPVLIHKEGVEPRTIAPISHLRIKSAPSAIVCLPEADIVAVDVRSSYLAGHSVLGLSTFLC